MLKDLLALAVGNVRPLQSRGVRQVYHWGECERLDGCCALSLGRVGRRGWVETAQMARVETRTASLCASDRVFLTRRGGIYLSVFGPSLTRRWLLQRTRLCCERSYALKSVARSRALTSR